MPAGLAGMGFIGPAEWAVFSRRRIFAKPCDGGRLRWARQRLRPCPASRHVKKLPLNVPLTRESCRAQTLEDRGS